MQRYLKLMNQLVGELKQVEFMRVQLGLNSEADEVACHASLEIRKKTPGIDAESTKVP